MKKLNLQKIKEAIKGGFRPSRTLKNLGFGAKPQEEKPITFKQLLKAVKIQNKLDKNL